MSGTSVPELAVYYYLQQALSGIEVLNRYRLNKKEFDIYIPSLKIAIEYDGYPWHKNKLDSENSKDKICKEKGIRFIRLRDYRLPATESAEILWISKNTYSHISQAINNLFSLLKISHSFEIDIDKDLPAILKEKELKEKENSLAALYPDIAKEWHPTRNGKLKAENFSCGSQKRVWWLCPVCKNEWQATIVSRTYGCGCSFCSSNKWTDEELQFLKNNYSSLSKEKLMAGLPDRTWGAIKSTAEKIGLSRNGDDAWTDKEVQFLKDNYTSFSKETLLENLPNRTLEAVIIKAGKLGLTDRRDWTDEEIKFLQENISSLTREELLEGLSGRTWISILAKIKRLGLTLPYGWSKEKESLLREKYPTCDKEEIMACFPDKDWKTITTKARRMGLKRKNASFWTDEEINILKEYYPTEGKDVLKRLQGKTVNSMQVMAGKLGLIVSSRWTDAEIQFLKDNYSSLSLEELTARLPNRTWNSISHKISRLGLSKRPNS